MKRPVPKPKISGDASRLILRRTVVLMALFGVAVFVPLIMKLFSLQVMQYETLSQLAADNQTRISKITPPRGTVYDRNMNVLAVSADVENVCIDPNELGCPVRIWMPLRTSSRSCWTSAVRKSAIS